VDRVLTSGQSRPALAGARVIAALVERAAGRLEVLAAAAWTRRMPGRSGAHRCARDPCARHVARQERDALQEPSCAHGGAAPPDEFTLPVTDARRIRRIVSGVSEHLVVKERDAGYDASVVTAPDPEPVREKCWCRRGIA